MQVLERRSWFNAADRQDWQTCNVRSGQPCRWCCLLIRICKMIQKLYRRTVVVKVLSLLCAWCSGKTRGSSHSSRRSIVNKYYEESRLWHCPSSVAISRALPGPIDLNIGKVMMSRKGSSCSSWWAGVARALAGQRCAEDHG